MIIDFEFSLGETVYTGDIEASVTGITVRPTSDLDYNKHYVVYEISYFNSGEPKVMWIDAWRLKAAK